MRSQASDRLSKKWTQPVASFTASLPYDKDPKTTGRFDIYPLKGQGKPVTLTFSVPSKFSTPERASLWTLMNGQYFKPTLCTR